MKEEWSALQIIPTLKIVPLVIFGSNEGGMVCLADNSIFPYGCPGIFCSNEGGMFCLADNYISQMVP
jgi:hypothetical protein